MGSSGLAQSIRGARTLVLVGGRGMFAVIDCDIPPPKTWGNDLSLLFLIAVLLKS